MTWRLYEDGTLYEIPKHNWLLDSTKLDGSFLKCCAGNHRADATCTGCGQLIHGVDIQEICGDLADGFITAEIMDAIAAGVTFGKEVASTSH